MTIPPRSKLLAECLRYVVQSMDADDPNMDFIVSMWSYLIANGELTERQLDKVRPYIMKYLSAKGINPQELPEAPDARS